MKWARDGEVGTYVFTSSTSVYPQTGRRNLLTKPLLPMVFPKREDFFLAAEQLGFPGGGGIGRSFILTPCQGLYGPGRHSVS